MPQMKFDLKISNKYDLPAREAIAKDVINYIFTRTQKGKNKFENDWPKSASKYSKSYSNSLDFKNAKGSKTKVDLTLSGDMLTDLEYLEKKNGGKISIGFNENDDENNAKAEGHITGKYGKSKKTKKRDFLGMTQKVFKEKILKNYPLNVKKDEFEKLLAARIKVQEKADEKAAQLKTERAESLE